MGLFDSPGALSGFFGGQYNADPMKNDAVKNALLQAGFAMLAGRGNSAQNIGQAGLTGIGAYQGQLQQNRQNSLQDWQIEQMKTEAMRKAQEWKQQQTLDALPAQFMGPGMKPDTMDNRDVGMPGEQQIPAQQMDMQGLANAYMATPGGLPRGLQLMQMGQKDNTPIALGDGGMLVDRTGRVIASNPKDTQSKTPEALRALAMIYGENSPEYMAAARKYAEKLTTHQPGVSVSYGAPVAGVDASGNPVFFQPSKGGGAPAIVPGVAPPKNDKPLTEAQGKTAAFRSQMQAAEQELSKLPLDMSNVWNQADVMASGGLTNFVASPVAQRARQAQEQWSEAFLRFKTGAAATSDEVRLNVRTFFPQPGDSKEVIDQKKRMRANALADMESAATGKPAGAASAPENDPLGLRK